MDTLSRYLLAVLMGLLIPLVLGARANEEKPNILIIVSDDQGWNDIGYRNPQVQTPNLDKLARNGIRLPYHYLCPTCSPTRAALLTGRFPSRYGIHGPIAGKSRQTLPRGTLTLPALLSSQGYETFICGKWHLGLRPEVGPRAYGFDHSYGYLHGQIDPITKLYKFGDKTWHRNDKLIEEEGHATDLLSEEAVRIVSSKREKPFFLYVPYSVPHTPFVEEEKWLKPYRDIKEASRRIYLASITHMDAGIGKIVEALEKTGQLDNTLLLFSSDNGGQRSGGRAPKQYGGKFPAYSVLADNKPLRGWKGDLYEGGIRGPAFLHWPGRLKPGISKAVLHAVDWLPTLAAVIGAPLPEDAKLDGKNVQGSITKKKGSTERILYWHTGRQSAIRAGSWKLVQKNGKMPELFNLAVDPNEKKNLAKASPEKLQQMIDLLKQERAKDRR